MLLYHHLFATMKDVLEDIVKEYAHADSARREELNEQIAVLKQMNDDILEGWMQIEEKIGALTAMPAPAGGGKSGSPHMQEEQAARKSEHFIKGQGYYKLHMFKESVKEFEQLVRQYPDFALGRIFLAMSHFRLGDAGEAYRHFQLLLPLTDDDTIKAISYNAMGCIQFGYNNLEKACELFRMACHTDPQLQIPAAEFIRE